MKELKREGLVLISTAELERISGRALAQNRNKLLAKKYLTLREILSLEVLEVKTKQGLRHWIDQKRIKPSEVMTSDNGIIKISTTFLTRCNYV